MTEKVMVVKNELLRPFVKEGGRRFIASGRKKILESIRREHGFMPREKAEHDPFHKQVIPYVAVRFRDSYFLLKRTVGQSEKRLHNKYSLGIGGHINPLGRGSKKDAITEGLMRELSEEISVSEPSGLSFIGVIVDESTPVGRVHLGLSYVLDVSSPKLSILEGDKMTGRWVGKEGLSEFYEGMETWSQMVKDFYITERGGRKP